jgi:fructokinase
MWTGCAINSTQKETMHDAATHPHGDANEAAPEVIAWGEVLWDCLPRGMFLGGAPFNVACHCARLGLRPAIASAVGRDFPGRLIRSRANALGVDTRFLAEIPEFETGNVLATLDENGNASYEISHPVAWDHVPLTPELLTAAARARAIVFGSLAQRDPANRESLLRVLEASREGPALRVFDVNLRPPFDSPEVVFALACHADLIKLNGDELELLAEGNHRAPKNLPELCKKLSAKTGVGAICVTLGADGAAWWTEDFFVSVPAPLVQVVDTVGAGDSFLARLLAEHLRSPLQTPQRASAALGLASELGAFVASREGATPEYHISQDGKIAG